MDFIDIAIKAAEEAGKIHKYYQEKGFYTQTKTSYRDRVTTADIESEKAITSLIKKHFPEHNIIGEEETYPKGESDYIWVIDPLDGTNNYSRGFPYYGVSIALVKGNTTLIGVVLNTVYQELFYAQKGKGAYLNNQKIKVSDTKDIKESLLITGFYQTHSKEVIDNLDIVRTCFNKGILGIRRTGSAALDLCQIAAGRADGFWEPILNPWDFKAGEIIVEEAGGMCSDYAGKDLPMQQSTVVASNGIIHNKLLEIIRSKQ